MPPIATNQTNLLIRQILCCIADVLVRAFWEMGEVLLFLQLLSADITEPRLLFAGFGLTGHKISPLLFNSDDSACRARREPFLLCKFVKLFVGYSSPVVKSGDVRCVLFITLWAETIPAVCTNHLRQVFRYE
jgi:hypothetical protein